MSVMKTNSRQQLHTKVAEFPKRQQTWEQAITAAEQHVKLGQTLQGQGLKILEKGHKTADPEQGAKFVQQATATIEKGVKIERDARDKLIDLYQQQPKEK